MKKIVINTIHGGFGLSPLAAKKYLEKNGNECYFFLHSISDLFCPLTLEEAEKEIFWIAFTEPAPEKLLNFTKPWDEFTDEEKEEYQITWNAITLNIHDIQRDDETLISTVEELKEKANGKYSNLKIVEIPDDVDWLIQEYDGVEWIAEKHRIWN